LRYLFESYAFDTDRRELHREADVIAIAPQVFDLLEYLIRNRQRVVSKDDLINAIWSGRAVSDAALTTRLNVARNAIGDSGEEQRLIKTLPRKGFRFVGQVLEERGSSAALADKPEGRPEPALALPDNLTALGTLIGGNSAPRLSIVVLPLANLGGGAEQDYFADGITESLTTDLSRITGSFVIARNTAFTFKNRAVDVKKIGRELNVRYVLEGSVQRGSNRLRVNVKLISTETGNHLWAERFDKPLADLFDMQDEIVARLANALNAELLTAEAKQAERVLNPNAMELYFQGMAWFFKGPSDENMAVARDFFEKALTIEPNSVEALVGRALVEISLATTFVDEARFTHFAAAEPLLAQALALAPNHARAHAFLGLVQISTRRVEAGLAQCERALALDRNSASTWGMIAYGKQLLGHFDQSELHVKEAERLSPRDIVAFRWMNIAGVSKVLLGEDAAAVSWFRRCIDANRNYSIAHFHLAAALGLSGQLDEAQAVARTALMLDPKFTIRGYRLGATSDNPTYLAGRVRVYEGMSIAGLPEGEPEMGPKGCASDRP
jgi:TolB-like protein/DNA-binding winged helix-turn-helix (wHTH) protein/Tfp pilus assembly protein PilF